MEEEKKQRISENTSPLPNSTLVELDTCYVDKAVIELTKMLTEGD